MALITAIFVTAPSPRAHIGPRGGDAEALAITSKHCIMCHSHKPTHPAFQEPPKNVMLDNIADMRRFAQQIYLQTVQNRAMPLGNQTGMTDAEREALGRWVSGTN